MGNPTGLVETDRILRNGALPDPRAHYEDGNVKQFVQKAVDPMAADSGIAVRTGISPPEICWPMALAARWRIVPFLTWTGSSVSVSCRYMSANPPPSRELIESEVALRRQLSLRRQRVHRRKSNPVEHMRLS